MTSPRGEAIKKSHSNDVSIAAAIESDKLQARFTPDDNEASRQ